MDWQTLRNQFMRDIGGDPPGAHLEDELIAAYTEHPDAIERSIEKITLAYKAGKIHSPWGALKTEVAKAVDASRNPTHDKANSRQKQIQRAEQWIRVTGLHYDPETEILDEMFGERGRLRDHHTPAVEKRILDLWNDLAPLGVIVEQEAEERGRRYVEQRDRLQAELKLTHKLADANIGNIEAPKPEPTPTPEPLLDDDIPF